MKELEVRLNLLEMGLRQTQEEVGLSRVESTTTREVVQALDQGMKEELSKLHIEIANVNQRNNGVLEILSRRL